MQNNEQLAVSNILWQAGTVFSEAKWVIPHSDSLPPSTHYLTKDSTETIRNEFGFSPTTMPQSFQMRWRSLDSEYKHRLFASPIRPHSFVLLTRITSNLNDPSPSFTFILPTLRILTSRNFTIPFLRMSWKRPHTQWNQTKRRIWSNQRSESHHSMTSWRLYSESGFGNVDSQSSRYASHTQFPSASKYTL